MKQAKILTDKELKKTIDYIDAFDRHAERNRAIVLLTHYLGLRISECGSLLVSDVINDDGEVNDVIFLSVEQTKGSDSRRVFVSTFSALRLGPLSCNAPGQEPGLLYTAVRL